jgi:glycogen synthase
MTDLWKNIQDHMKYEKIYSNHINSKVIVSRSYLESMYWARYNLLKYVIKFDAEQARYIKKKIICEIIYMMWIKKKLNSRSFNKVLFDQHYMGGYMIKQKIRQSLTR